MSALYLISPGSTASRDHGRIHVCRDGVTLARMPLGQVENVVVSPHAHMSMPLIFSLLEHGKMIFFVDGFGRLQGSLGDEQISLERLETQRAAFDANGTYWIRYILEEKLKAQFHILRTYAKRKKDVALSDLASRIHMYRKTLVRHEKAEELRGVEGNASRCYFSAFPYILDQSLWHWEGRNRRPPRDGINALLSFGYTLLERDVRIAIAGAGLDARLGFFHSNNGRKDSLVYDLMEPFRQPVIDRFILRLVNLGIFTPSDFEMRDGGCKMKLDALKQWFPRYEEYLDTPLQDFQGQSPKQYIRFRIEQFGMFVFERGALPEE